MADRTTRRSSIDRTSIESILTSRANTQPADPPSPRFTRLTAMDPPPIPSTQGGRPLSISSPRVRPNRLSLQFPVYTNIESARPTPTSITNTNSIPATPTMSAIPSPNDPNGGFLEALAGQERKVLELKEELEKAEADLLRLKRTWAHHEASKKKVGHRHAEQMQPLQNSAMANDQTDGEAKALRQSIEMDRRKAALTNIPRESRRRVFTGHHTRTLSLLSPERSTHGGQPFPPVRETSADGRREDERLSRSTTVSDTTQNMTRVPLNRLNRHSYQGTATHNVKQIAEDVKAGLWTFLEDLRQATVGDEPVNGTARSGPLDGSSPSSLSRKGSKSSLLTGDKVGRNVHSKSPVRTWETLTGSLESSEAKDSTNQNQRTNAISVKKKSKAISLAKTTVIDDLDDDWSNWDSPTPNSPRWSGSTLDEPLTPEPNIVTQSIETTNKDEILWPDLKVLTPSHLQRTVSSLMKEWEKSLTPPPEDSQDSQDPSKTSHPQSQAPIFSNIDACLM